MDLRSADGLGSGREYVCWSVPIHSRMKGMGRFLSPEAGRCCFRGRFNSADRYVRGREGVRGSLIGRLQWLASVSRDMAMGDERLGEAMEMDVQD